MTHPLRTIPDLVAEIRTTLRCIEAKVASNEIRQNAGILIDVREPAETIAMPTPGAINIPRGLIEMKIGDFAKHANHPIYVYCATGARASFAAEQLQRLGYQNVSVITCSIESICQCIQSS